MTNAEARKKSECLNPKRKIATQVSIVWSFGFQISFVIRHLELDGFIGLSALGAAGHIHIGLVGVDVAAFLTTEDAVLAWSGLKAAAAEFLIDAGGGEAPERQRHIGYDDARDTHLFGSTAGIPRH